MTLKKVKAVFPLIGLSKPKSCTLTFGKQEHFFWPKVDLPQDRFDALWTFCRDNWDEKKYGVITHEGLGEDGEPINPILVDITLNPNLI